MKKINFGCGGHKIPGWENYDIEVDITKNLPFGDGTVDFILAEHVYEHVTPHQGICFLQECHRILKPHGVLRLCVPTIDKILERYDESYLTTHGGTIGSAIEMMSSAWGHQALYTQELLLLLLQNYGFVCVEQTTNESEHLELQGIDGHPMAIGAQMNWVETTVIEATKRRPKVFDCFLYFNEDAVLEIRLNELKDVVDHFVIVESDKTFTGNDKPFNFDPDKPEFVPFKDKITHVKVTDMPDSAEAWDLEHFQRNAVVRGLSEAKANDIIMLSDVDEIPRADIVLLLAWSMRKSAYSLPQRMRLHNYYFFLNAVKGEEWLHGPIMMPYEVFTRKSPQYWRLCLDTGHVDNSGWHFSYIGGEEKIRYKIESFSHTEFNNKKGKDKWVNLQSECKTVDFLDGLYPKHLAENLERYRPFMRFTTNRHKN